MSSFGSYSKRIAEDSLNLKADAEPATTASKKQSKKDVLSLMLPHQIATIDINQNREIHEKSCD
jgi:hypothetical protein